MAAHDTVRCPFHLNLVFLSAFLFLPLLVVAGASAQGLDAIAQQNMAFDQQMQNQLQGAMQQNQYQMQQLQQNYIQQNGAQLQRDYQQYVASTGMQIPFQQFVYYHIMTQGGRNAGPALQQQQQNFRALQDANRTVQQGYDSYNQGWQNNQRVMDNAANRYSNEAIQGNAYYQNPQTGEMHNLPYGAQQGYYGNNDNSYYNDQNGGYHQVDPQGYTQELYGADPYED